MDFSNFFTDPTESGAPGSTSGNDVTSILNNLVNAAGSAFGASQTANASKTAASASASSLSKIVIYVVGGLIAIGVIFGAVLLFRRSK